ncbi:IX [California sea lion adenovirus 1]|uniref:IX n=1 Tax=California sea lion adenovirus 1 TaxID=943083 RepID=A0A059XIE5_9ADEN|nr:IX [California sea lion adenovirus 1]AIA22346.1 IX [California sea lion adenovirus 1]
MDLASGSIHTSFLTARLPTWAGSRQNIQGSNMDGLPILPSNEHSASASTYKVQQHALVPVNAYAILPTAVQDLEQSVATLQDNQKNIQQQLDLLLNSLRNYNHRLATVENRARRVVVPEPEEDGDESNQEDNQSENHSDDEIDDDQVDPPAAGDQD